ncbi:metallophosphoesterase [Solimonas soli]|uniref:metallophosphoesterase n=1 Tax=Solimonas soli TaxID=413479 RepID=UPI0004AE3F6D|nr:metallophosphoesterase [Solimonas soli]
MRSLRPAITNLSRRLHPLCAGLALVLLAACRAVPPAAAAHADIADGAVLPLVLLETTDLHSRVLSYDYQAAAADPRWGFERVATLIGRARTRYPNNLLFDVGDTIQGNALADYQARVAPLPCDEELAIYRAMDVVGYDAATLGNHEFNFGLPFLAQVTGTPMPGIETRRCAGPHFPLVSSNVYAAADGEPLFRPWLIVDKTLRATLPDGTTRPVALRVGLLGFAPPKIMKWDRANLQERVRVDGAVEAARRWLPELEAQHPDLIVALIHGGPDASPYDADLEDAAWYLAAVPGIDALLMGHTHALFPGAFGDVPQVDATRGLVRGVPAVMAGYWGRSLGLVHLRLRREGGRWHSERALAYSELWPVCSAPSICVAPDPRIAPLLRELHERVIAHGAKSGQERH